MAWKGVGVLEADLIEERAAILEYDAGMTREEAEDTAARAYGYRDWKDYEDDKSN
jgi:hypothetical protein